MDYMSLSDEELLKAVQKGRNIAKETGASISQAIQIAMDDIISDKKQKEEEKVSNDKNGAQEPKKEQESSISSAEENRYDTDLIWTKDDDVVMSSDDFCSEYEKELIKKIEDLKSQFLSAFRYRDQSKLENNVSIESLYQPVSSHLRLALAGGSSIFKNLEGSMVNGIKSSRDNTSYPEPIMGDDYYVDITRKINELVRELSYIKFMFDKLSLKDGNIEPTIKRYKGLLSEALESIGEKKDWLENSDEQTKTPKELWDSMCKFEFSGAIINNFDGSSRFDSISSFDKGYELAREIIRGTRKVTKEEYRAAVHYVKGQLKRLENMYNNEIIDERLDEMKLTTSEISKFNKNVLDHKNMLKEQKSGPRFD